jgi:hypothetical protein
VDGSDVFYNTFLVHHSGRCNFLSREDVIVMATINVSQASLDAYAQHLVNDHAKWCGFAKISGSIANDFGVVFEPGSKFIRVVTHSQDGNHRSSHSFIVNKTTAKWQVGDILKAASWKAPAQNFKRGRIDFPGTWKNIRWSGL